MDLALFQSINSLAGQSFWLDQTGIFLASNAGYVLLAILCGLFILRPAYRKMVILSFISAGVARGVLVSAIRFFYHRPRPISVDAVQHLVSNDNWAFPSGHASFFFALSTGVYLYNKKLGIVFYAVSILMGLSRIFIGVHWPTDILGGIILGIITAVAIKYMFEKKLVSIQNS